MWVSKIKTEESKRRMEMLLSARPALGRLQGQAKAAAGLREGSGTPCALQAAHHRTARFSALQPGR